MASHRQRCIAEYFVISYAKYLIAETILRREISRRWLQTKLKNAASLLTMHKNIRTQQQQLFTSHFRYILKLFHLDLKKYRKLKYTRYIYTHISFIEQPQFRSSGTYSGPWIYFRREITFFALAVFSPWNEFSFESKEKLLSNAGFNNDATGIIPLSPPHPPEYLTENTTTYYDS